MANNIVELVQKHLGYPPLQKVDPNVHEPRDANGKPVYGHIGQAAIPAVLAALYKMSQSEAGIQKIRNAASGSGLLQTIYEGKENTVIDKVARYAGVTATEASDVMEKVAQESVLVARQELGPDRPVEKVKTYFGDQRHNILVYLPAALQMGYLLGDNTIDDRTNKMEGPISSFMHKIEDKLAE